LEVGCLKKKGEKPLWRRISPIIANGDWCENSVIGDLRMGCAVNHDVLVLPVGHPQGSAVTALLKIFSEAV
jgi:hypothetical protein